MKKFTGARPGVDEAIRDGGWSQAMDGEAVPAGSTLEGALYWRQIYSEMLKMEEKVLARIDLLMDTQSEVIKREVELANVPVVVAQARALPAATGLLGSSHYRTRHPAPITGLVRAA